MTTEHWTELYFDEKGLDAWESGLLQDGVDRLLIASHKDIFTNFWAIPCPLDRRFLRRAISFLIYGSLRCSGLMQALRLQSGDMLAVFEAWDRDHGDKTPEYFESLPFLEDLIDFAERKFAAHTDPALLVTTRFYRAYLASEGVASVSFKPGNEARLSLNSEISLVTVQGDVVRVLDALRREERPGWDCAEQIMTFVVHRKGDRTCGIHATPHIGAVVLDHARRCSPVSEVLADFERNDLKFGPLMPRDVAQLTIDNFERDGLIRRVPSAPVSANYPSLASA